MTHGPKVLLPALKATFEISDRAADILKIEPHVLTRFLILLEFHPAVLPKIDLLCQSLVYCGQRFLDMCNAASSDLVIVLWNQCRSG